MSSVQVVVIDDFDDSKVYLYKHCDGETIEPVLRKAMGQAANRYDDASYLARIIFCAMVEHPMSPVTGYGIAGSDQNATLTWTIDTGTQSITDPDGARFTFKQFAAVRQ